MVASVPDIRDPGAWTVRSAMRDRDRVVILCHGSEVCAKSWFEEKQGGTFLVYTDRADLRGYRRNNFSKKITGTGEGRGKLHTVSKAAAVAMAASASLRPEALEQLMPKRCLTPAGKLPAAGCLKDLFDLVLKDLEAGVVGPGFPAVVAQMNSEILLSYEGLRGVRIEKAMDTARECIKELQSLGVEFGRIQRAWDEERVRQVMES